MNTFVANWFWRRPVNTADFGNYLFKKRTFHVETFQKIILDHAPKSCLARMRSESVLLLDFCYSLHSTACTNTSKKKTSTSDMLRYPSPRLFTFLVVARKLREATIHSQHCVRFKSKHLLIDVADMQSNSAPWRCGCLNSVIAGDVGPGVPGKTLRGENSRPKVLSLSEAPPQEETKTDQMSPAKMHKNADPLLVLRKRSWPLMFTAYTPNCCVLCAVDSRRVHASRLEFKLPNSRRRHAM